MGHWAVSSPMFDASTFEAWGVIPWHMMWFVGLRIHCLDVDGSSLHGGKAASSSVLRVSGSSYVHWDWAVVPAMRRVRGVVLWVSPLIEGSVCIGVSIVPLIIRGIVVSAIS